MPLTVSTHTGSGSPTVAMFGICSSTVPPFTAVGPFSSTGAENGYTVTPAETMYVTVGTLTTYTAA